MVRASIWSEEEKIARRTTGAKGIYFWLHSYYILLPLAIASYILLSVDYIEEGQSWCGGVYMYKLMVFDAMVLNKCQCILSRLDRSEYPQPTSVLRRANLNFILAGNPLCNALYILYIDTTNIIFSKSLPSSTYKIIEIFSFYEMKSLYSTMQTYSWRYTPLYSRPCGWLRHNHLVTACTFFIFNLAAIFCLIVPYLRH